MKIGGMTGALAAVLLLLLVVACGSSENKVASPTPVISKDQTFAEGTARMGIETLDTGLIKGHSYAEAAQGARIDKMKVTAQDEKGQSWVVIEIPEEQSPQKNTLFFEVTVAELPRGQQVTITTTVSFTGADGSPVERTVADRWPP